ncbi:hypothetical protein [Virgibacillus sp. MG-45]|uniref:hypothetical protein n=1 Tax=Virgibacillus sp. MG-45 TaxID=3102791 RepID=UPI002ED983E3
MLNDQRTTTIIKEILYWKQHKLLPEMYCDFLLALYTNGEASTFEDEEKISNQRMGTWTMKKGLQFFLLVLLVPFSFLVIYFTQFQLVLQLSILLLFFGFSGWMLNNYKHVRDSSFHIALVVMLILFLIISDFFVKQLDLGSAVSAIIVLFHFIFWFWISRKLRLNYLMISSFIGLFIAVGYLIL